MGERGLGFRHSLPWYFWIRLSPLAIPRGLLGSWEQQVCHWIRH
uniref:Uncharacterized protein n=1 Tax=Anguilla anguilla TaxID=7936 RepID=A0A0E9WGV9_ANGAN